MKQQKLHNKTPKKEFVKKWFSLGISNSLFIWIYEDHINWCLHEDAPYKDTLKTEVDQTIGEYKLNGPPDFIPELFTENEMIEISMVINNTI